MKKEEINSPILSAVILLKFALHPLIKEEIGDMVGGCVLDYERKVC